MVIDFHTHAFPEKIADAAIRRVSCAAGNMRPQHDGTLADLKRKLAQWGVDKAVLLNIATNAHQEKSVNDFAIETNKDDRIISFGSVYPQSENAFSELERLKESGIKGIKLHPDYQNFYIDDERIFPLYEKIAELGFITVFHAGVDIGYPEPTHCTPPRLSAALPVFGGAPVVAAHFGGMFMCKDVLENLIGKDVYLDTAFSYSRIPCEFAREIIEKHGADRILFGSDMPWSKSSDEMNFVKSLELGDEINDKIFYKNAQKLLQI